jgi:crotonobetainyl-CoA:carnitine CoA-transferase CaiB-like acyl-CoA transferase
MLDRAELDEDPRFVDNSARCVNQDALYDILRPIFASRTIAYWLETGESCGIPVAPIRGVSEVVEQEQAHARDMIVPAVTSHPVRTAGIPIKLEKSPGTVRMDAAPLGRDSRSVLAEVGYATDDIDLLVARGVVVE